MTSDEGDNQGSPEGPEEQAANLLNATMVTAIGLAICVMGVWVLWQFGTAFWSAGAMGVPGTNWMKLPSAAVFIIAGVQVIRYGARMFRSKRQ